MGYSFVSKCNHTRKVMHVNLLCFSATFAEQGFVEIQKFCTMATRRNDFPSPSAETGLWVQFVPRG